jgi:hypothetical protein
MLVAVWGVCGKDLIEIEVSCDVWLEFDRKD